ncbi:hypothetical protein DPMN_156074 [Dreissena polymorpha]|uniref:Uncharacterized protein n=1 Tax=Dreissena polymorpha TaxID=45954 RepID=A0A9D4JBI1_DREPO|nr:hypothetical protein DPMN_156074 [Dreissena polymorpha]
MPWPSGRNKSAQYRRSGSPTPRDNPRIIKAPIWGKRGHTGQLASLRRHFHTGKADGTETPHCTFGMRGPSGEQVAKFRRSGSPTPRDNRDFRLLLWGNGANTGQLAYLRRHFHRKRWH